MDLDEATRTAFHLTAAEVRERQLGLYRANNLEEMTREFERVLLRHSRFVEKAVSKEINRRAGKSYPTAPLYGIKTDSTKIQDDEEWI